MLGLGHSLGAPASLVGGAAADGVDGKKIKKQGQGVFFFDEDKKEIEKVDEINRNLQKVHDIDRSKSHILLHPISIRGKSQDDKSEHPPYHMTVKWFGDKPKRSNSDIHEKIEHQDHSVPDDFEIVPHYFDGPKGRTHVLLLQGLDHHVQKYHNMFQGWGNEENHPVSNPHVTISKDMYEELKGKKYHPKDLDFKIHPLEYRVDDKVIKQYHPIKDHSKMEPEKLEKPISHVLKVKHHYNEDFGKHYKLRLISNDGRDETPKLGHLNKILRNEKDIPDHVGKIKEHLSQDETVRMGFHPSIKQYLPKEELPEPPSPPAIKKSESLDPNQVLSIGSKLKELRDKIKCQ